MIQFIPPPLSALATMYLIFENDKKQVDDLIEHHLSLQFMKCGFCKVTTNTIIIKIKNKTDNQSVYCK